jgi:putative iron-dependent peroxidase
MELQIQNVLDYHGDNATFMVWNFKSNVVVEDVFKTVCTLVINP